MLMKKFFKKRWHSIPIGLLAGILSVCLVAGSVFAYNFLTVSTKINVDEPMEVSMRWYDYNTHKWTDWWDVDGTGEETTLDISPAETQTLGLRINNRSYGSLTVHTLITGTNAKYFTFDGFPNGVIPGSDGDDSNPEWETLIPHATIKAKGDTPPGIYNVTFTFTRE